MCGVLKSCASASTRVYNSFESLPVEAGIDGKVVAQFPGGIASDLTVALTSLKKSVTRTCV